MVGFFIPDGFFDVHIILVKLAINAIVADCFIFETHNLREGWLYFRTSKGSDL